MFDGLTDRWQAPPIRFYSLDWFKQAQSSITGPWIPAGTDEIGVVRQDLDQSVLDRLFEDEVEKELFRQEAGWHLNAQE